MKTYRFTLERILNIRKYRELEWELLLAAASGKCIALQNELSDLGSERRRILLERFTFSHGDAGVLAGTELYLRRLAEQTKKKRRQLEERERERDEIRGHYLTASKERKVLDKLKEKRAAAHYRQGLMEEVKMIDDTTNATSARLRVGE